LTSDAGGGSVRAPRGWWARHWKWFVPALVLGVLLTCGGGVTLLVGSLYAMMRSSTPYQHGVELVQNHVGLRDLLGDPIEPGFFFTGELSNQSGETRANYRVPVIGPKGRGVLVIDARKISADEWEYMILRVEIFGEPTVVDLRGGG